MSKSDSVVIRERVDKLKVENYDRLREVEELSNLISPTLQSIQDLRKEVATVAIEILKLEAEIEEEIADGREGS